MAEQQITTPVDIQATLHPEAALSSPYRYSQETFSAPEGMQVTEFERTPEGFLELEWQYKDIQRALALDFNHVASGMSRDALEEAAKQQLELINASRSEKGVDQIEPRKVDETVLRHLAALSTYGADGNAQEGVISTQRLRTLARPAWHEHVPTDESEESLQKWEAFKGQYPESTQINLEEFRELDGKMRVLSADTELQQAVGEIHKDRLETMRIASAYMGADRKIDALSRRIADVYKSAGLSNRSLTGAEQKHVEKLQASQIKVREARGAQITTPEVLAEVRQELRKRVNIERRRDFERGLVLTDQMKVIIDELLPSLAQGRPALLIGDTGGAKTALAEYTSRHYFGTEPEFISGYGDVNSYQVMGKMNLKSEDGASVSDFVPGPVVRAMEAGKPLILDEINAMPPEFLKRLNKIIQLKPGDTFTVQEDSGREVTIRPGFVIIGTANEKSKRYKGVEDLSVEFQNRFGANVVRVHYPDHDVVYGQPPVENTVIAVAALTDRSGGLTGGIPTEQLEQFVRACHVTQQVFSGNNGQGFRDYVTSERIADGKPGLDEAVLAPRTMVALLEKVRYSHGKISLDQAVRRFVSGVKSDNDKKQLTTILQGYGFMGSQG